MSIIAEQELPKTAFGELLVGQLHPVFSGSFEYTVDNTELNINIIVNGGTITQADAMAVIGTSTTTASSSLFLSKRHAKYHPGLGSLERFTALFTSPVTGTEQYAGIMDETGSSAAFENGLAVGYDGTTFGVHRWANDEKFTVPLENCDDPLDGTGASGMTFVKTNLNVFFIRFQYLGAGAIEFCIEDDSTGLPIVFHRILYANNFTVPSSYNPNYHQVYWVDNKSTTSDIIIKSGSYAYFVEGKTDLIEIHLPQQASGTREKTSVTTEVAIFTIRNKSTYASKANFIDALLENLSGSIEAGAANNLGTLRIVKNATLGGTPSYSDINTSDSIMEIDVAGTTVTGGAELFAFPLAGKNDKIDKNVIPYKIILGDGETITIAGSSASSATIRASALWKELF